MALHACGLWLTAYGRQIKLVGLMHRTKRDDIIVIPILAAPPIEL